jgi:hypothetical protein
MVYFIAGMLYGSPLTNKLNPEPVKLGAGQSTDGRKGTGTGRSGDREERADMSSFDSSFTDSSVVWTPLNALSRCVNYQLVCCLLFGFGAEPSISSL